MGLLDGAVAPVTSGAHGQGRQHGVTSAAVDAGELILPGCNAEPAK